MNTALEQKVRRLEFTIGDLEGEKERLQRDLNRLRTEHENQGRHLDGLRGAVDEMVRELDQFLDDETRTIYDVRTALVLLKAAR